MLNRVLNAQIQNNNLSHAYIFQSYDEGLLEKNTIKFIKEIFKDTSKENSLEDYYSPDLLKVKPDGNVIKIASIRDAIKFLNTAPTVKERKIILIEEAHKFNKESANALLKVLEEPPSYALFILQTNNEMAIIETLYSRCQFINFFFNENEKLASWKEINDILIRCFKRDILVMFDEKEYLNSLKLEADKLYNYIYSFFYDLYLYKTESHENLEVKIADNISIYKNVSNFNRENIYLILDKIVEIWDNFKTNVNFQLSYEKLLLYIMEEQNG